MLGEITSTNLSYFSMKLKKNHFVLIYILDSLRKKCELTQQNYECVTSDNQSKLNWCAYKFINLSNTPPPFTWLNFKQGYQGLLYGAYVCFQTFTLFFCSILLFLIHLYQYSSEFSIPHLSRAHHFLIKITWLGLRFTSLRSCYLPWINYTKTCWLIDVACQKRR